MANIGKLVTFLFGVIVLGALSETVFGYFTNITNALSSYSWAATLVQLGIVIGLVYMFIPRGK